MPINFESIRLYCKKRKRARNIKKNRDSVPPYLKKTFVEELNYKLWITKSARFVAADRCKRLHLLSMKTIGYLTAYIILVSLIQVYQFEIFTKIPENYFAFTITALSILILIFSQFENAYNFQYLSIQYHNCAREISSLYNQHRIIKTFENHTEKEREFEQISKEYDVVLSRFENHEKLDMEKAQIGKPYFQLSKYQAFIIKRKFYFNYFFKYHFFIWSPLVVFILYQLYCFLGSS